MEGIVFSECDMHISYLAGIFDGEGCISVMYSKRGSQWYIPLAQVSMYCQEIVEMFADMYGGKVQEEHPNYIWRVTGDDLKVFCTQLKSFVKFKKRHLEIALELLDTFGGLRGRYMTKEVLNRRRILVDELRKLQLKGPLVHTDAVDRVNDYPGSI